MNGLQSFRMTTLALLLTYSESGRQGFKESCALKTSAFFASLFSYGRRLCLGYRNSSLSFLLESRLVRMIIEEAPNSAPSTVNGLDMGRRPIKKKTVPFTLTQVRSLKRKPEMDFSTSIGTIPSVKHGCDLFTGVTELRSIILNAR